MSRNIDNANSILFENIRLYYHCSEEYKDRMDDEADYTRYISGSLAERHWLEYFNIDKNNYLSLSNSVFFYKGNYDESLYLIVIGLPEPSCLPEGLEMIDLNAGSFLAICSDLELMVKEEYPPLKIMELILSQHSGIDGYSGHDFNYLIPLFPKISIIKINSDILGVNPDNLELISSLLISYNSEFIKLPINSDTLEKIQQLCYKNFNLFRYDNLFQTLITTNFKFAFLNLYRSVEMLYQLCYISDLGEKLDIDKIELLNAIDITLKWKPNERNSLCKILNGISPNERQILTKQLPKIIRETTGETISSTDSLWSWLYDLRCNIVHLKVNHSVINISNKNWNLIFQGLIEVLISTYNFYD